jgi:chromosome segregation ATPase
VEDIALLENRIEELCDDAEKQEEDHKRLVKELEALKSESREKESARGETERKMDSVSAELRMERDRARNYESRITELASNLAVANAAENSARENLLRLEERMRSDVTRMRELESRGDRLATVEEKLDRAETERAIARAELSILSETKSSLEMKLAQMNTRRYEEVDTSNRKNDQELVVYRDQNLQRRPSIADSSSNTPPRRRGEGKNSILVGASAFAGGLSIFALKLLAKATSNRD